MAKAFVGSNPTPRTTVKPTAQLIQLLIHLKSQGYSEATLRAWSRRLSYLAKYSTLQDPEAVKRFIAEQQWSSGYKGNMVNAYQHYVDFYGLSWSKPFYERVEKIQRIPRTEDINKIISGASLQYALAYSIIRDTGIRPIECSWLRVRDIDEKGLVYPRTAKHGKARILKLKPSTVAMLNRYVGQMDLSQNDKLFHSNKQIKDNWMRTRTRVARKLGEPRLRTIKLYDLRHHFATKIYIQTKDIVYVQRLLGHKNIQNTLRYLGVVDFTNEEYTVKVARTVSEDQELIEAGFQYVTERDGLKLFRKRK